MKIAVISDIHGNSAALDAVLSDIERRGISRIVNLGDTISGPLDPKGTAARLLEANIPTV
ncbi:MAG: metallophosphoesterase family protein, partial [Pseudomonadota bacterium]